MSSHSVSGYSFAAPFQIPAPSPIRSLAPYANRPGTISMAGGYPATELFDVDGLNAAAAKVGGRLASCLQYSNIDGQAGLRMQLARLSAERGIRCDPDTELAVTGGSQQSLALLGRVLLQPGDAAIIESPGFPNSRQALHYTGATLHTAPSGPDGVDVDALALLVERVRPKLVSVVATFSNPCGATLNLERRRRLVELAARYRFLLVEDDPYGELRFEGEPIPPLLALAEGEQRKWVAYIASMSKTMAPALRMGWLIAPDEIRRRCVSAKAADDMASSAWIQEIVAQYIEDGRYHEHVPRIRAAYAARADALARALAEEMGSQVDFRKPQGGMFCWARLTGDIDSTRLLPYAIEHEVVYVPGKAFYGDPAQADLQAMRLSFATMNEAQIRTGIVRLRQALQACAAGEPTTITVPT
ncbi:2-aminoadipate aminotransferase [Bordetella genomosp. 9]|uniref:2-aminoadipate aminotransferase n=1 Tax=Bordetella genomosp. 9 TaxID=1416803 RepID=A0A261R868_9BORD|nr:PLP-dependent aminotransferase family protein [Bordetella genomosp. 9]OZI20852.1 2-aminoadipate aminotransferase [Bordetella genomosp. 9]